MSDKSPSEQIRSRITASKFGTVFIAADFRDLASSSSVRKCLSRLEKTGLIRRVLQGVYEYHEYSEFLGEYIAPSTHQVALSLARNYSWTIVPNGDTALNQLGLSTQVPAEWTYVSDGPYKEYLLGKTTIRLKRTANKDISKLPYNRALLVQAIKAIGKENLDGVTKRKIANLMTDDEKEACMAEGKYMTTWVYEALKDICGEVRI